MSNSYFQFKQFTIWQDACAMKVTTDGCLFGAIVAKELSEKGSCRVLDVGAGTGLLSLMVAQKNKNACIDAVEIEAAAMEQAKENVTTSPWSNRIQIINTDILQFQPTFSYDFILSNPPFYESQLSSPVAARRRAHHSSELTFGQLFARVKKLLKNEGKFFVIVPFYRTEEVIAIARANEIFLEQRWLIRQTPTHSFFRTIMGFSRIEAAVTKTGEIVIREQGNGYSENFIDLLEPFYLHL